MENILEEEKKLEHLNHFLTQLVLILDSAFDGLPI